MSLAIGRHPFSATCGASAEAPVPGCTAQGLFRVGSVPYLNVRPLLRALRLAYAEPGPWQEAYPNGLEVVEAVPRELARRHRAGECHASIVPVFEHLSRPGGALLPGTCIAARGPVESVVLFSPGPLEEVRDVMLDPASLTSVNLLKVLWNWEGFGGRFVDGAEATAAAWPPAPGTARLLIGDEALRHRGTCAMEWDLAREWQRHTGLPFVFAAWHCTDATLARPGSPTHGLFVRVADLVESQIEPAAMEDGPTFGFEPEAALAYLRRAIWFRLESGEQEGIRRFEAECRSLGLI